MDRPCVANLSQTETEVLLSLIHKEIAVYNKRQLSDGKLNERDEKTLDTLYDLEYDLVGHMSCSGWEL